MIPARNSDRHKPLTEPLTAANNTHIKTWGRRSVLINFGRRSFRWPFVVAAVHTPILGSDFLRASGYLLDIRESRLVDRECNNNIVPLVAAGSEGPHTLGVRTAGREHCQFRDLLLKYPNITTPSFNSATATHGVTHSIVTEGPLPHAKPRRLDPKRFAAAKSAITDNVKLGIARRSHSAVASPIVVVPKPDGSWRVCGDYVALNAATRPDRYPLPHILDFTSRLSGTTVFSKIDLLKGYHQIPMDPAHIYKTAVTTPFGLFEFTRMPFGLRNAGNTFQRMMDVILEDMPNVFCYLDDLLIASANASQHLVHVEEVLERLSRFGLVINPQKCEFNKAELTFLGHRVSAEGAAPLEERIEAIKAFPKPATVRGLQEFLGLINFYRRFLPNIATTLLPLYSILKATGKANCKASKSPVHWNDEALDAFEASKRALANATMLVHPDPEAELALTTDASGVAVGAVLEQRARRPRATWQPLAFFSKKLRDPEVKYSAYDRELLAMKLAVRHFRWRLEASEFTLFTDHMPLTFAMNQKAPSWTPRQQRTISELSEYPMVIRHVSGKSNSVADALSRAPPITCVSVSALREAVPYEELARAQQSDQERPTTSFSASGLCWQTLDMGGGQQVLCDVSTSRPRPWVPQCMRRKVFEALHGLSHPSVRSTLKLISTRFVWHGMSTQCRQWAKQCLSCQRAKIQRHTRSAPAQIPVPSSRFAHIHVDLVGPLPPSQGHSHLLTIVDRFTRWPEAIPLQATDTISVARALVSGWICRYGVPADITSDRGAQFTSNLWKSLGTLYGAKLHHTTSFHPCSNGLVERFHRHLKASLKATLQETGSSWLDHLPWVLLGIRTSPKEDFGTSSAEMVFGALTTVPGDFLPEPKGQVSHNEHLRRLRATMGTLAPFPATRHGMPQVYVPPDLQSSPFVFVRRGPRTTPLQCPYTGPYRVVRTGEKTFTLDYGGQEEEFSIDRLKPAHVSPWDYDAMAVPPRRGRPPRSPAPRVPSPALTRKNPTRKARPSSFQT